MKTTKRRKTSTAKRLADDPGGRAQAVYDQLRESIVRGSLAPGSPIIERPFAEKMGVSRGSLRLALRRLEHEGFVSATAAGVYTRAVVTPLTVADMDDIYMLIAALNGAGARQAAELPELDRQRLADRMADLNDELSRALERAGQNFAKVYDIDHQFHMAYLSVVGGPRLHAVYDAISSQGERYGRAYSSAVGHVPAVGGLALASSNEHRAIVDAIRDGRPEDAERAALTNWRNAARRLRVVIASSGERGSFLGQLE
jgi:DNA-binding GntR family transcriptional regulator